mgnify:CR=1 FL=1
MDYRYIMLRNSQAFYDMRKARFPFSKSILMVSLWVEKAVRRLIILR